MHKIHYLYDYKLINKAEKKTFETIDSFEIMQQAAKACFSHITNNFKPKKILILCGPGNNGGDGILIANLLLKEKYVVDIHYPLGLPKTKDSKKALELLIDKSKIKENISSNNYDLIIDSLFGTGFNKKLNQKTIFLFNQINSANAKIISIDIPSGVSTDNGQINKIAIKATTTLSLHRYKPGQWLLPGKEYCGDINLLEIGLINLDNECSLSLNHPIILNNPSMQDHKFLRGTCLIVAGENLIGAAKLACLSASQSALRSGAGLCKLLVQKSQVDFFKSHILEEMLLTYHDIRQFQSIINNNKYNSIIYGCGVDINFTSIEILKFLLKQPCNLVLDASIFTIIQENRNDFISLLQSRLYETIMTPHAGEFKRIFTTTNNKINDCLVAAKETNSVIVYKGNDTVIGTPEGKAIINSYSTPYLATAGSGDVLAGLMGGFLSQNLNAIKSAQLSCFIHSQCGINLGKGLIASDLIKEIPKVIKKIN